MVEQCIYIMQYYSMDASNAPRSPIFQTAYETNAHERFMLVCIITIIGWNSGFDIFYLLRYKVYTFLCRISSVECLKRFI